MVGLFRDWALMDKLRISWTELQEQPQEELCYFQAFMAGEAQARVIKKEMPV